MAWLVIMFFLLYGDARSLKFSVWVHFFNLPPYMEREKTIWILYITFADGGNRTQAACVASECAIHYSIASRLSSKTLFLALIKVSWKCFDCRSFQDISRRRNWSRRFRENRGCSVFCSHGTDKTANRVGPIWTVPDRPRILDSIETYWRLFTF